MTRLRESAGLSREQAAERVRIDPSSLWRLETARNRPLRKTVLDLLDLYGVTEKSDQEPYVDLLAKSNELNWLAPFEETLNEAYQTYISMEADAVRLTSFENVFVPGLLQTPDYARALIRGTRPTLTDEEVMQRAEVRARRQDSVTKKNTKLWMVLDEAILYREVGGPAVMKAQLDQLLEIDDKRTIVQVVPFGAGAHPCAQNASVLMEFREADLAVVYIELLTNTVFLEKPEEVALHRDNFEHLIARALSPEDTRKMIIARRKGYS
jgi:transcriptional regulator with XRE-family HTH domain